MYASPGPALDSAALFYHPAYLKHDTGHHPESANRLHGILAALRGEGIQESDLLRPQPVDLDVLAEVHDRRYVEAVQRGAEGGGGYWDLDTYISPGSYHAAVLAAGAATGAVDTVMSSSRFAFALVRPPGHHALRSAAMGFCLLNNVAVAAHYATRKYGLERVLIVDWDVHHGNGTQDLFYTRPDVLFFSTHQYPFYPGTGAIEETGEGPGEGYTVNVPLPATTDDSEHIRIFNEVLAPLARRYRPQLILVSAGYDSHIADPIGGMAVTVAGFAEMARIVRGLADELCEGRVAAVLEGGYNVQALAKSVLVTIAMMSAPGVDGERTTGPELTKDGQWAMSESRSTDVEAPALAYGRRAPIDIGRVIERVKEIHRLG